MTARDDLFGNLMLAWEYRTHENYNAWVDDSNELIDAFAHELAEQIREATFPDDDHMEYFYAGVNCSADLIDPEVEN